MTIDRRALMGATAAFAALPFAASATPVAGPNFGAATVPSAQGALAALWGEVVDLSMRLGDHATPIVHPQSGLPGWMYDAGAANALGNARYGKLIEILRAKPENAADLAIIARAARHPDIENGPRTYGAARLAYAATQLAA